MFYYIRRTVQAGMYIQGKIPTEKAGKTFNSHITVATGLNLRLQKRSIFRHFIINTQNKKYQIFSLTTELFTHLFQCMKYLSGKPLLIQCNGN